MYLLCFNFVHDVSIMPVCVSDLKRMLRVYKRTTDCDSKTEASVGLAE